MPVPVRSKSVVQDLVHNPAKLEKGIFSFSKSHQEGDIAYTRRYLLALGLSRAVALVRYAKKPVRPAKRSKKA